MRHPRDRANATGDARIVSRVFSNPRAGCSKSNLTFQGVEREPDACFNSLYTGAECCLGACRAPRGRCVGGVCECHASFAGFDCSDHPADGHPAGFIYVHAPPPKLGLHNALRFQCHRNTYDSDWHFLRRLLVDPLARSPSIDAATLFYVPVWAAASWGNIAAAKFGWSAHRALEWVGTRHRAHWEANASRYLMYFTADKGACRVPRWGQINMVHLGLTTPFQFQVHPGDWKYNASATVPCPPVTRQSVRCPQEPACFTEGHDFAMPFYIAWNPEANVPPRELLALQHENRWECELYFAGSLQHGRFSPFYAQQVRQRRVHVELVARRIGLRQVFLGAVDAFLHGGQDAIGDLTLAGLAQEQPRAAEVGHVGRLGRGQFDQRVILEHPRAGDVALLGVVFPEGRQRAHDGKEARRVGARLDPHPGLFGPDCVGFGIGEGVEFLGHPAVAAGLGKPPGKEFVDHPQVGHVGQRVGLLRVG